MTSFERIEACADKGNIIISKLDRSFLRNLRKTSLDRIEAYAEKGNIIGSKPERSFLGNFFVICEFHSQSYS